MKRVILLVHDRDRAELEIAHHHGRATHRFGKDLIIARIPDGVDPNSLLESREVDATALTAMSASEQGFVEAFHDFEARRMSCVAPIGHQLPWDAPGFQAPKSVSAPVVEGGPGISDHSRYLQGRVAVGLVIVSGPTKSLQFSLAEVKNVMSQVLEGLDFLVSAEPTARLNFTIELQTVSISTPEDTTCEASCDSSQFESCEAVWRNPAMVKLGYKDPLTGVMDYVAYLQTQRGINWAYVAYFTKYTQCHFAYSSPTKLRLVIQYDNDGRGPDNIHTTFAHETCHIFNADDEYKSSNCKCGEKSGYWEAPNNNCENCPGDHAPCLMADSDLTLCFWSRRQLGWGGFGPEMKVTDERGNRQTSAAPALAEWNGTVTMVYRSSVSSEIWSSTFDGKTWGAETNITDKNDAKTATAPSLAVYKNRLTMAYRSSASSSPASTEIWSASTSDGKTWGAETNITDKNGAMTSTTPVLCAFRDKLYMFYRSSVSSDLWMCSFDGTTWGSQTNVTLKNGAKLDYAPALAEYDGKLWVAHVGEGGSTLFAFSYDGNTFSKETKITDINGAMAGFGLALAKFNGFLYMLYQSSTAFDLWACTFDGTTWLEQWNVTKQNGAETSAYPALAPLSSENVLISVYRGATSSDIWFFQVFPDAPALP